MNVTEAATKYAALSALGAAIAAEQKRIAVEVTGFTVESGITKGTLDTPLGPVTLRENKASRDIIVTDEKAFIKWCEENLPSALLTYTVVAEASRLALLTERFKAIKDDVLDSTTGEVIGFVAVRDRAAAPPTVSYGASDIQKKVKQAAESVVIARTGQLVASLVEAHEITKAIEAAVGDDE